MIEVVGIDPGTTTGAFSMVIDTGVIVEMTTFGGKQPSSVAQIVSQLTAGDIVAVEHLILSNRTGQHTRKGMSDAIAASREIQAAVPTGVTLVMQTASQAKGWATNARLKAARQRDGRSLFDATRGGGGHDRDAARHALYNATRRGLLKIPLADIINN